jgi:hypothetical protein
MWHDLTPSKIDDEDTICNLKNIIKIYYFDATWHFVMSYNIDANNGE